MGFRDNVQTLLAHRGWSQRELAAKAGISPGAVGNILDGESVNLRTAGKVAAAFIVEVADLVREEKPMEPGDELDVALRHQGDLSQGDILAVHAFISYIRGGRSTKGRRGT
ncbi:MAG TPA: helix-turn-helix transcriptional regulator [Clostridia bacterium]|nr:helix-turn-helix transcriptional regulator [Clostridia bacterium]